MYLLITQVACKNGKAHIVSGDKGKCRNCNKEYKWKRGKGYIIKVA